MAIDSDADLDALFNTAEHAVAATYTPSGGSAISTNVILDRDTDRYESDGGHAFAAERRTRVTVRVDEVPTSKRGDTVLVGGTTYTVDEIESDDGVQRTLAVVG